MGSQFSMIFDYLNNNRHKFDEDGRFDPTPDWRDHVPFGGVTHPNGGYGKRPKIKKPKYAGKYGPGEGPDDLAKKYMKYYADDYAKGIRYDLEKCHQIKEFEEGLCRDGYGGRALHACLTRVNDRFKFCKDDGHFNNAPDMWTAELISGQPLGDEDLDKRRKPKPGQKPQSHPAPKPQEKPDKSKFSLGSMFSNALRGTLTDTAKAALALNPALWSAVDPNGMQSTMNSTLRNFVMLPSDYPERMRPVSAWSPQPFHYSWLSALPTPFAGATGLRMVPPSR